MKCPHYRRAPLCPKCHSFTYLLPQSKDNIYRKCPNCDFQLKLEGKALEEALERFKKIEEDGYLNKPIN